MIRGDEAEKAEERRILNVYAERARAVPADRYSLKNRGNLFLQHEKDQHLWSALRRFGCVPLSNKRVLDVGCGPGWSLWKLLQWGARPENLFGVDLIQDHIANARRNLPPEVTLETGNAARLHFPDKSFDLVLQFTIFSSILHEPTRAHVAAEMVRVLKPTGYIVWYDFFVDNPRNPSVRGVSKGEINRLFPQCECHLERITLAPPLARTLGKVFPQACAPLSSLKCFCTHYMGFLQRRAE